MKFPLNAGAHQRINRQHVITGQDKKRDFQTNERGNADSDTNKKVAHDIERLVEKKPVAWTLDTPKARECSIERIAKPVNQKTE